MLFDSSRLCFLLLHASTVAANVLFAHDIDTIICIDITVTECRRKTLFAAAAMRPTFTAMAKITQALLMLRARLAIFLLIFQTKVVQINVTWGTVRPFARTCMTICSNVAQFMSTTMLFVMAAQSMGGLNSGSNTPQRKSKRVSSQIIMTIFFEVIIIGRVGHIPKFLCNAFALSVCLEIIF